MALTFAFEGIDGSGKSTLVSAVHLRLCELGYKSVVSKEPGSPLHSLQGSLRNLVLHHADLSTFEREILFTVDASCHRRALEKTEAPIVLSDRGLWSHMAYLRGSLKTGLIDYDEWKICFDLFKRLCFEPAGIIYLSGGIDLMRERMQERGQKDSKKKDVIESRPTEYFKYVLETYEDLMETSVSQKVLSLDARNTIANNVAAVVEWMQYEYRYDELTTGKIQDFSGQH